MNKKRLATAFLVTLQLPLITFSCEYKNHQELEKEKPKKIDTKKDQIKKEIDKLDFIDHKNKHLQIKINKKSELKINQATEVQISRTIDGDTFEIINPKKDGTTRIRFSGVDTPEKYNPRTKESTRGVQYEYALKASNYTENFVRSKKITNIYIVPQKTSSSPIGGEDIYDHYGRVVAIIYGLDKSNKVINLNYELVKNGFALKKYISLNPYNRFYTTNKDYYYLLEYGQKQAKNNKVGIWEHANLLTQIYPKN